MRAAWLLLCVLAGQAHAGGEVTGDDLPACDATRAHCIGIKLHVAVEDTDIPIATLAWLAGQLATANKQFTPIDVGFEVVGITTLPATAMRIEDRKERDTLGAAIGGPVIDVFITGHLDDIDVAGAMAYGVTWRKGNRKFVILSTQAWERTLAHELGHFFGLPHSTYAISLMNKTERTEPPPEERTFAAEEFAAMKPRVQVLLRAKVIANRAKR